MTQQIPKSPSKLRNDKDYIQFIILAICVVLGALLLISIPTYTEIAFSGTDVFKWVHHYIGDWHWTEEQSQVSHTHYYTNTFENIEFQIIVVVALVISIAILVDHRRRFAETRRQHS